MRCIPHYTDDQKIEAAGRVTEAIIPDPDDKRRYPRAATVYGVVVNTRTKQHFAFNRDYVILPVKLKKLPAFKNIRSGERHGWGPHCPINTANWRDEDVYTGFIFNDANPPEWRRDRLATEFFVPRWQTPENRRAA